MEKMIEINSLKDIINIKCDEYGEKTAFLEKDKNSNEYQKINYLKVKEDVNSFGSVLLKKFGLKNKKIAVIGENSYRWYVTYMATVCGVGVIVPLDKELPANEIVNLLERSKVDCIVYSTRRKELIEGIKENLSNDLIYIEMNKEESDNVSYSFDKLVEEGQELISTGYDEYINTQIDIEKFSILLFTSGTTGNPKGVMLNHKNICANIRSCYAIVPQMGTYTTISILPIHHTYEFTLDYLFGTCCGSTIGICEGIKYINKNLKEIKPDILIVVPALVEKVNQKIEKSIKETGKENLISGMSKMANGLSRIGIDFRKVLFKKVQDTLGGNLKCIFCGAAPIDKSVIYKMESYGFKFYQGYGITEASPLVSGTTLNNRVAGTVGKAVYGTEVRIDLTSTEEENSNIGEIIAKGDNIMMGYYDNEEETEKVLKKGWLYTGDIGHFDENGNLVVTGRKKNVIVTSNGKNIYPEEIEFLVNKISLVAESMVYGKKQNESDMIVSCKVTIDYDYLDETYGANKPTDEELHKIIWDEVKNINRALPQYKAIKELEIKKEDFSKTTTMKIKRHEEIK